MPSSFSEIIALKSRYVKLEVFLIFPSQTPAVVFFSRVAQDFGGDLAIIDSIDMEVSYSGGTPIAG